MTKLFLVTNAPTTRSNKNGQKSNNFCYFARKEKFESPDKNYFPIFPKYLGNEPNTFTAMAMLHSRVGRVFYFDDDEEEIS